MSQRPDPLGPSFQFPAAPPPDPTGWHRIRRQGRAVLWPPRPVAWAALLALLVSAAGVYGIWFQATLPGRLPSLVDWKAVAAVIARDARPGDAIALAPAWAERGREVFPEWVPSRSDVPLPVLALPSYAAQDEDLAGIRRVWLVSLPDAPRGAGDAAAQLARRSVADAPSQRIGQLELARFDLRTPLLPLWSLRDASTAEVRAEIREVGLLPRSCVVARFPGPGLEPVTVRLADVPLGSALRGHAGLVGNVLDGAPPASVRLRVDGQEVARVEASARAPVWRVFQVEASRLPPGSHAVEIEIVPSGPLPRGVCVDLVALP